MTHCVRLISACITVALLAGGSAAKTPCNGIPVQVSAPTQALVVQTCTAATSALTTLAVCDLTLDRPVTVVVSTDADALPRHCVAQYDCDAHEIVVMAPALLDRALPASSRFARMPIDAYFGSLIAHEMTHAVMLAPDQGGQLQRIAQEYVAYAMQINALSPRDRAAFLAGAPDGAALTLSELHPLIMAMAPDLFAERAALHFAQPGNGCGFVGALQDGTVRFPEMME